MGLLLETHFQLEQCITTSIGMVSSNCKQQGAIWSASMFDFSKTESLSSTATGEILSNVATPYLPKHVCNTFPPGVMDDWPKC